MTALGPAGPPSPDATVVRPFAPSDLPALLRLENEAFGDDAYDALGFEEFLMLDASFFVAEVAGAFAGYSIGWLPGRGGELASLAVDPAHRRRGLARLLTLAVLDDLHRQGARSCRLQVRVSNLPAIDFYTRLGFKVVGLWREYYRDYESAYVMRMRLGRGRRTHQLTPR